MMKITSALLAFAVVSASMMALVEMSAPNTADASPIKPMDSSAVPHSPIRINSNADFGIGINGVSGGNGSAGSPWVIENWDINGTGFGYCIYVGNTTDYFVLKNNYLHEASGVNMEYFWDCAVGLYNTTNGNIRNNSLLSNIFAGIFLSISSYNTITNNTASSQSGEFCDGMNLYYSDSNIISNNNISNNCACGIKLYASNNNSIVNNTASNNFMGLNIYGSNHNEIINNNATLNDHTGIYLHLSNDNSLRDNIVSLNNLNGFYFSGTMATRTAAITGTIM